MKVILREDVTDKGKAGQVIDVKTGYARNYLIPHGLAYLANDANMKVYEHEKVQKVKQMEQQRGESLKLKDELEKISLTAVVKVGDDDQLFGSVTAQTIADLLAEKGYKFNHRKIQLDEPIKELGVFEAAVGLYQDVAATLKIWVVKE
jgi:large subunit ribosomal protein L9